MGKCCGIFWSHSNNPESSQSGARSRGLLTGIDHREDNNLDEEDAQEEKGGDYNLNSCGSGMREEMCFLQCFCLKSMVGFLLLSLSELEVFHHRL